MTMITPSYLGETIEYSSLHACRSTLEDPTDKSPVSFYSSACLRLQPRSVVAGKWISFGSRAGGD